MSSDVSNGWTHTLHNKKYSFKHPSTALTPRASPLSDPNRNVTVFCGMFGAVLFCRCTLDTVAMGDQTVKTKNASENGVQRSQVGRRRTSSDWLLYFLSPGKPGIYLTSLGVMGTSWKMEKRANLSFLCLDSMDSVPFVLMDYFVCFSDWRWRESRCMQEVEGGRWAH